MTNMKISRLTVSMLFLLAFAVLYGGCALSSKEVVPLLPLENVEDQKDFIFFDNFSQNTIGDRPGVWAITNGDAEVVPSPDLISGKAVRVWAGSEHNGVDTHFKGKLWSSEFRDVKAIAVEYQIKRTQGSANLYVSTGKGHHVNFHVNEEGQLRYRDGSGQFGPVLATLTDGWNQFKFTANRDRDEVYAYLNDMDSPIAGPLTFRNPIESWANAHIYLLHGKTVSDIQYGEFKVWAHTEEEQKKAVIVRHSTWIGDIPERPAPILPVHPAKVSREKVTLFVTENEGIGRARQPVASGIPLPKGHIWDSREVRLLRTDDTEVPLQTTVLSNWPDGSIRWLLLDFQATVDAGTQVELVMEYGSDVQRQPAHGGIIVDENAETVTVKTGRLTMILGKKAPFIRSLTVDGRVWDGAASPELVIEGAGGLRLNTSNAPYKLSVEESGTERVVLRVESELHDGLSNEVLNFAYDLRLHFHRDSSVIRFDPTITNLMGEHIMRFAHTELNGVALHFPGWLTPANVNFTIENGGEIVKGVASSVKLLQRDENKFEIIADGKQIADGNRSSGWAQFNTTDRDVSIGIRHFWQQAPKSMTTNEVGDLIVHLWAPDDGPLIMGGGEAKRHEIYVALTEEGGSVVPGAVHPLRAVASPQWYSETEAFGRPLFLVTEDELPLFDASVAGYEKFVEDAYEQLISNRDAFGEYGWRNFGDWSTTWAPDGWGNSEYDLAYAYFHQFARTGDLRYFDLAESAARHWMDVDMIWATNQTYWLGGGMIHHTAHRTYTATDHTWNQGLIDYYHLTGDRRALEASIAIGNFFSRLALERPEHRVPRIQQREDGSLPTRGSGWALMALVAIYESTLDPYFLEAAKGVVDILFEEQEADGQWKYVIPGNEIESRPRATKTFMTALILRGLGDYHRVTKEKRAADMLVKGLRFLVDEMWDEAIGGYPYIDYQGQPPSAGNTNLLLLDPFAYAYEITGDETFKRVGIRGFEATVHQFPGYVGNRHLGKVVAQGLRHTSHSLAVLIKPKDIAISAPQRIEIGRRQNSAAELGIVRSRKDEEIIGHLQIDHLPAGVHITPEQIPYEIPAGEHGVTVGLNIEVDPTVAPGNYPITVYDPENENLSSTFRVAIPGSRTIDPFDPPLQNSLFGSWSFRITEQESAGWEYDTDPAGQFFGDSGRMRRKASTEEFLIYDAPGLFGFTLTFYAPIEQMNEVSNQIRLSMSADGDEWEVIPIKIAWDSRGDNEYARGTIIPETSIYRGDRKLKVTVLEGGDPRSVQLGRIEIIGWQ